MGEFNQEKELIANLNGCSSEIQARVFKIINENSTKNRKDLGAAAAITEDGSFSSPSKRSRVDNGKKRGLPVSPEADNGGDAKSDVMETDEEWEKAGARKKKGSNKGYRRQHGLLLKHNLSPEDLNNKDALVSAVLKQKPDDTEIEEIKKTRKDDILIVGKTEKDFNSLCKVEKWKQGKYSFSPLLFFSENTARAVYFKDYEFNEDVVAIGNKL